MEYLRKHNQRQFFELFKKKKLDSDITADQFFEHFKSVFENKNESNVVDDSIDTHSDSCYEKLDTCIS